MRERGDSRAPREPFAARRRIPRAMRPLLPVLLVALALASCVSGTSGKPALSGAFVLSERAAEDGLRTKFRVQPARPGPALVRVDTRAVQVAHLGIAARALDRAYVRDRGLEPWRGVMITSVEGGSAAFAAGLRAGNVLLSLAGESLGNVEQFREVVEARLAPGVAVPATRLRPGDEGGWIEEELEVTPGAKDVDESTTERIELDAPEEITLRTGMQVATLPAELASQAGLGDASVALVTGVVLGAAAYDEGIRGGDRIVRCNGSPVAGAADVLSALRAGGATLDVAVEGRLGAHEASIRKRADVDARNDFYVPIVIRHQQRADRTRTSFLDFIFQFGFNYRRSVHESATREEYVSKYFSMLPFGMFELESSPERTRRTIFWLITWSTRR